MMDIKIVERGIILAIKKIQEEKNRPALQLIFDTVVNNMDCTVTEFKQAFDNLYVTKTIMKKRKRDSYYISYLKRKEINVSITDAISTEYVKLDNDIKDSDKVEDETVKEQEYNTIKKECENVNIMEDLIKNTMREERARERDYLEFLKEEIAFLKTELVQKNEFISILLAKLTEKPIMHMETVTTSNHNVNKISECKKNKQSITNVDDDAMIMPKKYDIPIKNFNKNKEDAVRNNTIIPAVIPVIEIIGDSHLNNIMSKGISNKNNVIIHNHPGSTSEDLMSYITPSIRKKRDVLVIHTGCNDLVNDIDTIKNLQSIIDRIKKQSSTTKIALSSVFIRKDKQNMENKVNELNANIEKLCEENLIAYISNGNIDETCLGIKKLHLNRKGTSIFARNLIDFLKPLY